MSRRPKNHKKNRPEPLVPPVAENARLAEAVQLFEEYTGPLTTIDNAQKAIEAAISPAPSEAAHTPAVAVTVPKQETTVSAKPSASALKTAADESAWSDFGDSIFDDDLTATEAPPEIHANTPELRETDSDTLESPASALELDTIEPLTIEPHTIESSAEGQSEPDCDQLESRNETDASTDSVPSSVSESTTFQSQVDAQHITDAVGRQVASFAEALRTELRSSIAELQASQAAAASAQSEVLKTLSEIIFQTAASREPYGDAVERAVAGMEDRLFARLSSAGMSSSPADNSAAAPTTAASSERAKEKHAGFAAKLPKPSQNAVRSWDEIRTELMSHTDLSDATVSIHSAGHSGSTDRDAAIAAAALVEATQLTSDRHFRLPEQDPLLEVPNAVDPESLNEAQLREAFREREAFISTLISRIRRQHENMTGLLSTEQLRALQTEVPEELENLIRVTLRRMDDLARMGELEMALERARIARQLNQLQHSKQLIEHNARQLGMTLNPDGSISSSGGPQRPSNSRRWLGKLGFGQ